MGIEVNEEDVTGSFSFRIERRKLRKWKRRIGVVLLMLGASMAAWFHF